MAYYAGSINPYFVFGSSSGISLSIIDVKQKFIDLGGKIKPNTQMGFSSDFPGSGYNKSALTQTAVLPPTHLCMGSMSACFIQPEGRIDALSIAVYRDTSGHNSKVGNHFNLHLQWEIEGEVHDSKNIEHHVIPISDGASIRLLWDDIERARVDL